jgi:hypothetical protein
MTKEARVPPRLAARVDRPPRDEVDRPGQHPGDGDAREVRLDALPQDLLRRRVHEPFHLSRVRRRGGACGAAVCGDLHAFCPVQTARSPLFVTCFFAKRLFPTRFFTFLARVLGTQCCCLLRDTQDALSLRVTRGCVRRRRGTAESRGSSRNPFSLPPTRS